MRDEVRVAVRSVGTVTVRVGKSRAELSPADAIELAGRLERAAEMAEERK